MVTVEMTTIVVTMVVDCGPGVITVVTDGNYNNEGNVCNGRNDGNYSNDGN